VPEGLKYCSNCGAQIDVKAEICPKCGVRQPGTGFPSGRNRVVAIIFALFLGGLGIHKFYLGQTGWGIVYLLFCWTLIPAIVALIEAIIYLTMTDQQFQEKYGQG
jgi:TM2 domain-containing membrane protein YozV